MTDIVGPASDLNAVTQRPSDGRNWGTLDSWFKDCSSPTSQDGTEVSAAWLNGVTGFFRSIIRANGVRADGVTPVNAYDQSDAMAITAVKLLIQRGQMNFARDQSVTAGLVLVTLPQAPPEMITGMRVVFRAANAAQPGATLSVNGAAGLPLLRGSGTALTGREYGKNDIVEAVFNDGIYQIVSVSSGGSTTRALARPWTANTAGACSYTPAAGVYFGITEVRGSGGSGAGTSSSSGFYAGPCGGGGGGYSMDILAFTPGTPVTGVVGAGGARCTPGQNNGLNGGTTSFSTLSATGGSGASTTTGPTPGGMGYGGAINRSGGLGRGGTTLGGTPIGGNGGSCWGSGECPFTSGGYHDAEQAGQGGSGGSTLTNTATPGGAGHDGEILVTPIG